ncbi:MAG: cysteine dioxygenase [Phycisphaerales bacterium JB043]
MALPSHIPHSLRSFLDHMEQITERASLDWLREAMASLTVTRDELEPFVHFREGCYERVLVHRSEHYELVCLCWKPGQRTPIHDHHGSSCGLRVISGVATEIRYDLDDDGICRRSSRHDAPAGTVCASQDGDMHEIVNLSDSDELISLHCYSPPIAQFHTFEEGSSEVVFQDLSAILVGADASD